MLFYIYDSITKAYLYSETAYLDPLETKKQNKEVYLQPSNSTSEAPLAPKEGFTVNFNNSKWIYKEVETVQPEETIPSNPELEEVKEEISDLDLEIQALKDQIVLAQLMNDTDYILELQEQYKLLIEGV